MEIRSIYGTGEPDIDGKLWVVRDLMGKTHKIEGEDQPIEMQMDLVFNPKKRRYGKWTNVYILKVGSVRGNKYQSNNFWKVCRGVSI